MPPFVHPSAEVEPGASVGDGTRIWRQAHVMAGAVIGERCVLGQGCFVARGARIGDGSRIQNHVSIFEGVELGRFVFVGPSATFTNVSQPRAAFPKAPERREKTVVGDGATIGANATVVCGTTIGRWAFVGAGAVVTRDVPAFALALGVPARVCGWVCACGEVLRRGSRLGRVALACAACGRRYRAAEGERQGLEMIAGIDPSGAPAAAAPLSRRAR
jgi:UDP-2-acetamido-3-amino-2,3-dideoxy-glucuronate N-acetyltransferase